MSTLNTQNELWIYTSLHQTIYSKI